MPGFAEEFYSDFFSNFIHFLKIPNQASIRFIIKFFCKIDQPDGFRVSEIFNPEISFADPDAVEGIGILEQGHGFVMWVSDIDFGTLRMIDYCQTYSLDVVIIHTGIPEKLFKPQKLSLGRPLAMFGAIAIMLPRHVVDKCRTPGRQDFTGQARFSADVHHMIHHPVGVIDPVQQTGMIKIRFL